MLFQHSLRDQFGKLVIWHTQYRLADILVVLAEARGCGVNARGRLGQPEAWAIARMWPDYGMREHLEM